MCSPPVSAQADPLTLVRQYTAAESRNDIEGMLALFSDDAILEGTGLCAVNPCVGKTSIRGELNRRVAASTTIAIASEQVDGATVTVRYAQRTADTPEPAERQINVGVVTVRDDLIASIQTSTRPRPAPLALRVGRLDAGVYIDRGRGLVVLTEGCNEPAATDTDTVLRPRADSEAAELAFPSGVACPVEHISGDNTYLVPDQAGWYVDMFTGEKVITAAACPAVRSTQVALVRYSRVILLGDRPSVCHRGN
jgi:hypothetical protein